MVFPDGCVSQLTENSLLAVDKAGGCSAKAVKTGGAKPLMYAQAIGGPRPTPTPPPSPPPPSPPAPPPVGFVGSPWFGFGAFVLSAGTLGAWSENHSISPR